MELLCSAGLFSKTWCVARQKERKAQNAPILTQDRPGGGEYTLSKEKITGDNIEQIFILFGVPHWMQASKKKKKRQLCCQMFVHFLLLKCRCGHNGGVWFDILCITKIIVLLSSFDDDGMNGYSQKTFASFGKCSICNEKRCSKQHFVLWGSQCFVRTCWWVIGKDTKDVFEWSDFFCRCCGGEGGLCSLQSLLKNSSNRSHPKKVSRVSRGYIIGSGTLMVVEWMK